VRLYLQLSKLGHFWNQRSEQSSPGVLALAVDILRAIIRKSSDSYQVGLEYLQRRTSPVDPVRSLELQSQVVAEYELEPYPGPLLLFRCERFQNGRFRDPTMGWGELVPSGLEVHEIAGGHRDLFEEPVVEDLGRKLSDYLAKSPRKRLKSPPESGHEIVGAYRTGTHSLAEPFSFH
jgi:thioesterase domain-containing protein